MAVHPPIDVISLDKKQLFISFDKKQLFITDHRLHCKSRRFLIKTKLRSVLFSRWFEISSDSFKINVMAHWIELFHTAEYVLKYVNEVYWKLPLILTGDISLQAGTNLSCFPSRSAPQPPEEW